MMDHRSMAVRRQPAQKTGGYKAVNGYTKVKTIRSAESVAKSHRSVERSSSAQSRTLRATVSLEAKGDTYPTAKKAPPRPPPPSEKAVKAYAPYYKYTMPAAPPEKKTLHSSQSESSISRMQPKAVPRHNRKMTDVVAPAASLQERSVTPAPRPSALKLSQISPVHRHSFSGQGSQRQPTRHQPVKTGTATKTIRNRTSINEQKQRYINVGSQYRSTPQLAASPRNSDRRRTYSSKSGTYINVQPPPPPRHKSATIVSPPQQGGLTEKRRAPPRPPPPYFKTSKLPIVTFDDGGDEEEDKSIEMYSYVEVDKRRFSSAELQSPESDEQYQNCIISPDGPQEIYSELQDDTRDEGTVYMQLDTVATLGSPPSSPCTFTIDGDVPLTVELDEPSEMYAALHTETLDDHSIYQAPTAST